MVIFYNNFSKITFLEFSFFVIFFLRKSLNKFLLHFNFLSISAARKNEFFQSLAFVEIILQQVRCELNSNRKAKNTKKRVSCFSTAGRGAPAQALVFFTTPPKRARAIGVVLQFWCSSFLRQDNRKRQKWQYKIEENCRMSGTVGNTFQRNGEKGYIIYPCSMFQ